MIITELQAVAARGVVVRWQLGGACGSGQRAHSQGFGRGTLRWILGGAFVWLRRVPVAQYLGKGKWLE